MSELYARPYTHIRNGLYVSGYEAVEAWWNEHSATGAVIAMSVPALRAAESVAASRRSLFLFADDIGGMSALERTAALFAAKATLGILSARGQALCCCSEGRNRACLVAALTLTLSAAYGGADAIGLVRTAREPDLGGPVLTNRYFVELIMEQSYVA